MHAVCASFFDKPRIDGVGGARRRNVNDGGVGAGFGAGLGDRVEHGQVEMGRAAFTGRNAADHFGAIGEALLGVEGRRLAGETLGDDFGVFVDQHGHEANS